MASRAAATCWSPWRAAAALAAVIDVGLTAMEDGRGSAAPADFRCCRFSKLNSV